MYTCNRASVCSSLSLSVCLSVCLLDYSKYCEQFLINSVAEKTDQLFGDDPKSFVAFES